jgi:hypothetical protein
MTRRIGVVVALTMAGLAIAVATGWGAGVLFYLGPGSGGVRRALAWTFAALGLLAMGSLVARRVRPWAAIGFVAGFALVLFTWGSATPSNDRDWQPEVAVLPLRHPRRRSRDRLQCPELRLPHGDGLHARLLHPHVRSPVP